MHDRQAGGTRLRLPTTAPDSAAGRILSQEPRELAAHELLALLLEPGLGRRRAHDSAIRLLRGFAGEDGRGPLRRIGRGTPRELCSVGGITPLATARLAAALELGRRFSVEPLAGRAYIGTARDVFERFYPRMRDLVQEEFWLLVLNVRFQLIHRAMISLGTDCTAIVHARDVFGPAIREGGHRVVLVHNHPSGDPTPSPEDRSLTARLSASAELVGIELWDHVVVGERRYFSFREAGLLSTSAGDEPPAERPIPGDAPREASAPRIAASGRDGPGMLPPDVAGNRKRRRRGVFAGSLVRGIDLARLERALELQAHALGRGRFEITGGEEPHFVDLAPDAAVPCDCGDLTWRGGPREGPCKHLLRARLAQGDPEVLLAVATLVAAMYAYAESLERKLRPKPVRLTAALKARVALAVRHPVTALTFTRSESDAGVSVLLGTTGLLLGTLMRRPDGVEFVPAPAPPAAGALAA